MRSEAEDEDLHLEPASPREQPWPPAEFELVLRKPISLEGVTVDRLQLREPTCWEWEQIVGRAVSEQRRFGVQLISGVSTKLIAQMGIGDVVRAERYLLSFFEVGQAIGVS